MGSALHKPNRKSGCIDQQYTQTTKGPRGIREAAHQANSGQETGISGLSNNIKGATIMAGKLLLNFNFKSGQVPHHNI